MPTYKTKKGTIKSKPIPKAAQKLLGMKPIRKKAGGGKVATPKTKTQAFADYKKKHGYHHKADPKHPMNAEGKGVMRKKSGGEAKKKVPTPKPLRQAMKEKFEENVRDANFLAPESGKGTLYDPAKNSVTLKKRAFNKTLKENPQAVKRLNKMSKKAKDMKSGGKLKMVEKGGKKVPFYAADGVGKMSKGGSMKIKSGDTLSQIAKKRGVTLKSLLAANPSIKNANQIKVGQTIKVPPVTNKGKTVSLQAGSKSKNPYEGMTQTEMNMLRSKDKRSNEAFTRTAQMQQKDAAGRTSPNTRKANAVKEKKSGFGALLDRARKMRDKKKATKRPPIPSNDIAAKKGGMMKAKGYKHGGTVRGAGAATKGKRYGRCG
jgi:LysM repeat protein